MQVKLKIKDAAAWAAYRKNNETAYGAGIINYAIRWGSLLQAAIETESATGKSTEETIKEQAKTLSHKADTEGITVFMYGAAVQVLSDCWFYGEQLRRWHNIASQIGLEGEQANAAGGVLNPALLSIAVECNENPKN